MLAQAEAEDNFFLQITGAEIKLPDYVKNPKKSSPVVYIPSDEARLLNQETCFLVPPSLETL